ncbi:MAG: rRNA adenine dimethyltransferase family protein, partial [Pseudomonadota bacterium]
MQHRPRKRFGQNFLHDSAVIDRIIEYIGPKPDDTLVEIGPGQGALTKPLLDTLSTLTAIELDRDLAAVLAHRFKDSLVLFQDDALKFDFSGLMKNNTNLRIVGNLPYNISTPLLFHLLHY